MKRLLLSVLGFLQRRRLRAHGDRVFIDPTTRLLRQFRVRFQATPQNRRYVTVGRNCLLNCNLVFEAASGAITIGDRCYIGSGTNIISREGVVIGNDVTIAWNVMLYDHNSHSTDWRQRARVVRHFYDHYGSERCFDELDWSDVKAAPIHIGDRAWIGFDAVILKGVTLGEGAVVAARAVVTKNVEPYTMVGGNPATVIGRIAHVASE